MSESADGLIDPATRQWAGMSMGGPGGAPSGPGSVAGPAGTDWALAIVVAASVSFARLSQGTGVAGSPPRRRSSNVGVMPGMLLQLLARVTQDPSGDDQAVDLAGAFEQVVDLR